MNEKANNTEIYGRPDKPQTFDPTRTDSPHRNPNFINTTITDPSGHDATARFQILHYHHDPHTRKRAVSRMINGCPPGEVCVRSFCRTPESPRHHGTLCQDNRNHVRMIFGHCSDEEICVGGRTRPGPPGQGVRAFCVSMANFATIAKDQLELERAKLAEDEDKDWDKDWDEDWDEARAVAARAVEAAPVGLEARLTATDGVTALLARELRLDAYDGNGAALSGGSRSCTDCSNLEFDPVPAGTTGVHSQVSVRGRGDAGSLHIFVR